VKRQLQGPKIEVLFETLKYEQWTWWWMWSYEAL
jgi:hypothetical protein